MRWLCGTGLCQMHKINYRMESTRGHVNAHCCTSCCQSGCRPMCMHAHMASLFKLLAFPGD